MAFVFPGGGSLGAAQVGMARALLESGIRPDVVVGCSVGALNAAFLAQRPTADQAERLGQIWHTINRHTVFGDTRRRTITNLIMRSDHLYDSTNLRSLIARCCSLADLSHAAIPVHVVTTDLDNGGVRWWSSGKPTDVLLASACLPGLFAPVMLDGSRHVDGGVLDPVPVGRAVDLGARTVYLMGEVVGPGAERPDRLCALDVLLRSFAISRFARVAPPESLARPGQQVVVVPGADTRGIDIRDFSQTARLMAEGYTAAKRFLATRAA
ncbi:MAG TPA: patatin-like phospholipase family protein [Acidimicrobiales bacterium]|nr:patatin-like phospholipase family protein [Acidimicrobiales bacterium]